jgi:RND family efflux transporter MFP subunit
MNQLSFQASTAQSIFAQITAVRLALTGAESAINTAEAQLTTAQGALTLIQAGPTADNVAALQAQVEQVQAEIDNAQLTIDNTDIVAPFSGIVRNVIAEPGMVVSPNLPVLSVINNNVMKIDAYASEIDVPHIQGNATAEVTLDAYGNDIKFPAKVTAVDTAETIVNGSPAYHVTLYFIQPDNRIRAGMIGDVFIVAAEHDNVIEIPSRLVLKDNNENFVLIQNGKSSMRRQVTLGLIGNDNMVEVISGLDIGEKISDF